MSPAAGARYAHPQTAAWTPASLPNLLAAWDFSDTAKITDAGAGAVSAVSGAYGTSIVLTQATSNKRPITGTRTINGRAVLDFDGTDDRLDSASFSTGAQPFTYAAVYQLDTTTSSSFVIDGLSGRAVLVGKTGGAFGLWAGSFQGSNLTTDTNLHAHIATFNGASTAYYADHATKTIGNPGAGSISAGVCIGNAVDNGAPVDGRVAEIIICSGTMGSTDRTSLFDHWTAKWATS